MNAHTQQYIQACISHLIDRRGWTEQEWIEDAIKLMNHPDGAITSLVNGHVMALINFYERTTSSVEEADDE